MKAFMAIDTVPVKGEKISNKSTFEFSVSVVFNKYQSFSSV